jgi:hypothetical protein
MIWNIGRIVFVSSGWLVCGRYKLNSIWSTAATATTERDDADHEQEKKRKERVKPISPLFQKCFKFFVQTWIKAIQPVLKFKSRILIFIRICDYEHTRFIWNCVICINLRLLVAIYNLFCCVEPRVSTIYVYVHFLNLREFDIQAYSFSNILDFI